MDNTIIIIGGLAAAALGAWLTYVLQNRVTDKQIFENWQNAFMRSAFRGRFSWLTGETKIEKFTKNLQDLKLALSQGVVSTKHQNPNNRGGGISQVRNKKYRKDMTKVYELLDEILQIVNDPSSFFRDDAERDIDMKRDEIILIINPIWEHFGLLQLKLPTQTGEIEK